MPNRSNYIHWIEDLLSSELIPPLNGSNCKVRCFDVRTGANCIYPLLGASLLGWSFVGADVTDVALEWSRKNGEINPHLSELIEIRNATSSSCPSDVMPSSEEPAHADDAEPVTERVEASSQDQKEGCYEGPPILAAVVKDVNILIFACATLHSLRAWRKQA